MLDVGSRLYSCSERGVTESGSVGLVETLRGDWVESVPKEVGEVLGWASFSQVLPNSAGRQDALTWGPLQFTSSCLTGQTSTAMSGPFCYKSDSSGRMELLGDDGSLEIPRRAGNVESRDAQGLTIDRLGGPVMSMVMCTACHFEFSR